MSDSDRGERTAALNRQLGYALALLLSCLLVGFFAYQSGHNTGTKQASAQEYEQAAKRNAQIACRDLEPAAIADCVYDEIGSAGEQSESEQDLNAQQWMAWWAGILTVITALTTLISWIALRYLRDTFRKTAEMARDAKDATNAMVRQNELTERSQRPWLGFEVAPYVLNGGDDAMLFLDLDVANYGGLPAYSVTVMAKGHYFVGGGKGPHTANDDKKFITRALEDGGFANTAKTVFPSHSETMAVHVNISDPNKALDEFSACLCDISVGIHYKFDGGSGWTFRNFIMRGKPKPTKEPIDIAYPGKFGLLGGLAAIGSEAT